MSEEFDILKQKQKKNEENKDGERNRSHSYLNEIIYGLQSQETEQRKLEIEEYENINLNINGSFSWSKVFFILSYYVLLFLFEVKIVILFILNLF